MILYDFGITIHCSKACNELQQINKNFYIIFLWQKQQVKEIASPKNLTSPILDEGIFYQELEKHFWERSYLPYFSFNS